MVGSETAQSPIVKEAALPMSTEVNEPEVHSSPQLVDLPPPDVRSPVASRVTSQMPVRISRAERKAATRKRILNAAREVFFRDGFMDTSLDEVASRADIGKGTLYRHFESKAELYVAVLMEGGDHFESEMLQALNPTLGALDQIQRIGEFYREFWTAHPNHFGIFWAIDNQDTIGDLPRPLLDQVREMWERPLRHLEAVIRTGVDGGEILPCDPWVMANVIWGIGNSGFAAMLASGRRRLVDCEADQMYRTGLQLVLRGLAPS